MTISQEEIERVAKEINHIVTTTVKGHENDEIAKYHLTKLAEVESKVSDYDTVFESLYHRIVGRNVKAVHKFSEMYDVIDATKERTARLESENQRLRSALEEHEIFGGADKASVMDALKSENQRMREALFEIQSEMHSDTPACIQVFDEIIKKAIS